MPRRLNLPAPPTQRQIPRFRQLRVAQALQQRQIIPAVSRRVPQAPSRRPVVAGQVYKPPPTQRTWTTQPREILAMISRYASERKIVIIRYHKEGENRALVTRAIEPYSLRYKTSFKRGRARYLYGYDVKGPTIGIHSFLLDNIVSVQGTNTTFVPRWQVEF